MESIPRIHLNQSLRTLRQGLMVERFSGEGMVLQFSSYYYEARTFDGGETYQYRVLDLRSRLHGVLAPVWETDWAELALGIRTRKFEIELQPMAGPVSVQFEQTRYGRFWNRREDEDEYSTLVKTFWWHGCHETVTDDTDLDELRLPAGT